MSAQRLDQIASYFNEKEKRRLADITRSKGELPEMTADEIKLSCIENDGYDTPELNDKLYLHFRGFRKIENLEPYTSCKALWLDSNGLEKLENLDSLVNLRCLYLAKNLICKIEGLECLVNLTSIDLSNNRISHIEGLSQCTQLKTINLSKNALSSVESIQHLVECHSIDNIDLTNNNLDGDVVKEVFGAMPNLVSLALNGNPVTQTPSFRKLTIVAVPKLCYLDRPVDEIERLGANAFVEGGVEAEKEAKEAWREKQKNDRKNEMESFRQWQREQYEQRKERGLVGKSCYITEWTAGEKAEREAEAKKAAEEERRMLDLGIGRVGEKYWQMQGQAKDGEDPLQMAVDSLLSQDAQRSEAAPVVEELDDAEGRGDVSQKKEQEGGGSVGVEDVALEVADMVGQSSAGAVQEVVEMVTSVLPHTTETDVTEIEETAPHTQTEATQAETQQEAEGIEESQDVRDQRVRDSLEIWRRQQEAIRQKEKRMSGGQQPTSSLTEDFSARSDPVIDDEAVVATLSNELLNRHQARSTWDSASSPTTAVKSNYVYWTEWMDIKLAELVRTCVFDFATIAATFQGIARNEEEFKKLPGAGLSRHEELRAALTGLSEEACRMRWAELDARRWSAEEGEAQVEGGDAPPVYRVCIKPDELGKGHGAQPSFQAMLSSASGSMPAYLKVPTAFPSTSEYDDGDDTDNDDTSLERLD